MAANKTETAPTYELETDYGLNIEMGPDFNKGRITLTPDFENVVNLYKGHVFKINTKEIFITITIK
jgi:hypothetical protein